MTAVRALPADIRLAKGNHESPDEGMCIVEAASFLAGEPFSDHPACVSPVIGAFCRSWNDALDDTTRQRLLPYAARIVGTATGAADDKTRAWLATDWLVRVQTPAWMRLAGLVEEAQALEALARITDATLARAAQPALDTAREKAAAAWAAAGDAAWAAARDAAGDAAGDAARDAAWDAAGDAARDAAWAAAWDAAWAAAWAAARDALRPTVVALQESAFGLLDAMIAVGAQ